MGDVPPGFLTLPSLASQPRSVGMTHVIDRGLTLRETAAEVEARSEWIDIWKFGWGTAYVDPRVADKVALLQEHGITPCVGGTLLEVAFAQGVVEEFLAWAHRVGFTALEVSRGSVAMTRDQKRALIGRASESFTVLAESGFKRADQVLTPEQWFDEVSDDLRSGAAYAVAEGRESGAVGIYDESGSPILDVVDAVIAAAGLNRAIFEAPTRSQQAWFINRHGPLVNLGNIATADSLSLATLRLGLRSDTLSVSVGELSIHGS